MPLTTVTVTGQYVKPDNTVSSGTVEFLLSQASRDAADNLLVSRSPITAVLNGSGVFSVVLIATDQVVLEPTGLVYRVTERIDTETPYVYYIEVPVVGGTVNLADVERLEEAGPEVASYALKSALAAHAADEDLHGAGGGGVSDHGALTGLGDDDHPQYTTTAEAGVIADAAAAFALTTHVSGDTHPGYATDADLAAHAGESNPHPVYLTDADFNVHTAAADPHPVYSTAAEVSTAISTHEGLSDPHPLYALDTDLTAKANLASPTFTGTPAAPTAAQGTNTTQLATTAFVQTEGGLLIPKSLVDAKGDILVGTADNTVARLAAGTNGHVLTADSTVTAGVKWAAAAGGGGSSTAYQPMNYGKPFYAGGWYTPPGRQAWGSGTNAAWVLANRAEYTWFVLTEDKTLASIGVQVVAAVAGGTMRIGVLQCDSSWNVTAVAYDPGTTIDASTTGVKSHTPNVLLTAGRYFFMATASSTSITTRNLSLTTALQDENDVQSIMDNLRRDGISPASAITAVGPDAPSAGSTRNVVVSRWS